MNARKIDLRQDERFYVIQALYEYSKTLKTEYDKKYYAKLIAKIEEV